MEEALSTYHAARAQSWARIEAAAEHRARGTMAWAKIDAAAERVVNANGMHAFRDEVQRIINEFGGEEGGCAECARHATTTSGDGCGSYLRVLSEVVTRAEREPTRYARFDARGYAVSWASSYHACVTRHVLRQMAERDENGELNPRGAYVEETTLTKAFHAPLLPPLP